MLENGERGRAGHKLRHQGRGGRQVQNVIIGKFLPMELLEIIAEVAIERRRLVRILSITQVHCFLAGYCQPRWKALRLLDSQRFGRSIEARPAAVNGIASRG